MDLFPDLTNPRSPEYIPPASDDLPPGLNGFQAMANALPVQNPEGQNIQRPRRTFDPSFSRRYGRPTKEPRNLVRYSPKYSYSRLFNFPHRGAGFRPRMNTIVVQVYGSATPQETGPRAMGGIFFGNNAPGNRGFELTPPGPLTAHNALLNAIRAALAEIIRLRHTTLDPRWKEVIFMTNSEYVCKSFSEWVWTWEQNGWQHIHRGGLIEHAGLIQDIHNVLTHIEYELNMAVRFWKVSKEDLEGARRM